MRLDVCFVGIGSIAKRHISNLRHVCNMRNIELHIDAVRRVNNQNEVKEYELENVYTDYSKLERIYDVIFITNPTELHLNTLEKVTEYGNNFFIEKPIVSVHQIDRLERFLWKKNAIYYVACPLRYSVVIQYIKNYISPNDVISVRSISSSYLPEWRSGTDYRNTYSAHKELGGGVSIDLIHEWDYLTFLFGKPDEIYCFTGKKSSLEIDSDDIALYIAEYKDKVIELHLDYFGRKTLREIVLFTCEDTIIGDIVGGKITFLKSGKVLEFNEDRDKFQKRELEHFLDIIEGNCDNDNNVEHAISVLKLSQGEL